MKDMIYIDLLDAISWDNEYLLTEALRHQHLDLTYEEGQIFNSAVNLGNIKIVSILIDYFFDNPPAKYSHCTHLLIQNLLKKQLRDILETAVAHVHLSKEMEELISKYTSIDTSNTTSYTESDDEQDLSAFDIKDYVLAAKTGNNVEELLDDNKIETFITESSDHYNSAERSDSYLAGQAAETDSP